MKCRHATIDEIWYCLDNFHCKMAMMEDRPYLIRMMLCFHCRSNQNERDERSMTTTISFLKCWQVMGEEAQLFHQWEDWLVQSLLPQSLPLQWWEFLRLLEHWHFPVVDCEFQCYHCLNELTIVHRSKREKSVESFPSDQNHSLTSSLLALAVTPVELFFSRFELLQWKSARWRIDRWWWMFCFRHWPFVHRWTCFTFFAHLVFVLLFERMNQI